LLYSSSSYLPPSMLPLCLFSDAAQCFSRKKERQKGRITSYALYEYMYM
jgi:hypothetical protein